jgi:NAD+ synthase
MAFHKDVLKLDLEAKARELSQRLSDAVLKTLKRRGVVVAIAGGIDSACVAALSVRALGPKRVHGLLLPERDSSGESIAYGRKLCEALGIPYDVHDIAPILDAAGCYQVREAAVRSVFPELKSEMPWKIVMHGDRLQSDALNVFYVVVRTPDGRDHKVRLTPRAYLEIVAATNFKQRTRKMLEYFHADRLHYAVIGTPNRLEYDQGFFVKLGDGAADAKPIAHLYKSQVYQLAEYLGVPDEIRGRTPTTDTYSLPQTQDEFYFSLPHDKMDLCLYARDHELAPAAVADAVGLDAEQVARVFADIDQKRRTTRYLHLTPQLVAPVQAIFGSLI